MDGEVHRLPDPVLFQVDSDSGRCLYGGGHRGSHGHFTIAVVCFTHSSVHMDNRPFVSILNDSASTFDSIRSALRGILSHQESGMRFGRIPSYR